MEQILPLLVSIVAYSVLTIAIIFGVNMLILLYYAIFNPSKGITKLLDNNYLFYIIFTLCIVILLCVLTYYLK